MSDRGIYPVRQGADHQLTLASKLGDTFTATCTAAIHRLPGGRTSNTPDPDVTTTYTVTTFAGNATYGPGFYLTLQDTVTSGLEPGVYWAQATIIYTAPSVWTQKTDPWLLEIQDAV